MTALTSLYRAIADRLDRADWLIPTLARFLFAAILMIYFLNSGLTKLGDGEGKQTVVLPANALDAFGDAFNMLKGRK